MSGDRTPGTTDDGRWVVVDGRRWRATDPSIPEAFRRELVEELMSARRAVGAARRADDGAAEAEARARVQDAKVALGERGRAWWEEPTEDEAASRLRAAVLALARNRGEGSTICPSDAARAVGGEGWRSSMDAARTAVRTLASEGEVVVLQGGEVIDAAGRWRGPVRVRIVAEGG
ncbi:DUF3253 domain-containing protein [Iamia majanohamensis]|uniref:DUF3253 domain-containing protein n=1 Tax=Iamia majanohamensis TaxID=467976 RepID=A0AAE9YBT0_9ACTN|nr:DUF3253 domain-containing protein [Iamia majanohamensis]WCO68218.1 DUF3253 domain-containing protein [Iamia majanohamensis]